MRSRALRVCVCVSKAPALMRGARRLPASRMTRDSASNVQKAVRTGSVGHVVGDQKRDVLPDTKEGRATQKRDVLHNVLALVPAAQCPCTRRTFQAWAYAAPQSWRRL